MKLSDLKTILPANLYGKFLIFKPFWIVWGLAMLYVVGIYTKIIPDNINSSSNYSSSSSSSSSSSTSYKQTDSMYNFTYQQKEDGIQIESITKQQYFAKKKEDKIKFYKIVDGQNIDMHYRIKIKDQGFAIYYGENVQARFKKVDGKINVYDGTGNRIFKVKYKKGSYRYYSGDSSSYRTVQANSLHDAAIKNAPINEVVVKAYAFIYHTQLF